MDVEVDDRTHGGQAAVRPCIAPGRRGLENVEVPVEQERADGEVRGLHAAHVGAQVGEDVPGGSCQLRGSPLRGLFPDGVDHEALAAGPLDIGVQLPDAGEHEGVLAVHMDLVSGLEIDAVAGEGPLVPGGVEVGGFPCGDRDIDAAEGIDDAGEGVEVDLHVFIDFDVVVVLDGVDGQLDASEGAGGIELVHAVARDLHVAVPQEGRELDLLMQAVNGDEHHGVGPLDRVFSGAVVDAEEQDVRDQGAPLQAETGNGPVAPVLSGLVVHAGKEHCGDGEVQDNQHEQEGHDPGAAAAAPSLSSGAICLLLPSLLLFRPAMRLFPAPLVVFIVLAVVVVVVIGDAAAAVAVDVFIFSGQFVPLTGRPLRIFIEINVRHGMPPSTFLCIVHGLHAGFNHKSKEFPRSLTGFDFFLIFIKIYA